MSQRFCWVAWFLGTALIVLSWVGLVRAELGWSGLVVACGTTLAAHFTMRSSLLPRRETALLTQEMLASKDADYKLAMQHLRRGGRVFYEGLTLATRRGGELCVVARASSPARELDRPQIELEVERVRHQFEDLQRLAPDIATAAADKKLRIILTSESNGRTAQVYQVMDGEID
jgi:hypothetical protein